MATKEKGMGTRGAVKAGFMMIHALCYVGNNEQMQVDFDATPWFEQASNAQIEALFRIGCAGDVEADQVAMFVADLGMDAELCKLLHECQPQTHRNQLSFDVRINPRDASCWLRETKPVLAERLQARGLLVR